LGLIALLKRDPSPMRGFITKQEGCDEK